MVFRVFLQDILSSGSIQVDSSTEARVVLDFMRPVAEGGGAGAAYKVNSWSELLDEMRRPEIVEHFKYEAENRFKNRRERPPVTPDQRRADLAAKLLAVKMFILAEEAPPPDGRELLDIARTMRWTASGALMLSPRTAGLIAELGNGRLDALLTDAPLHEAVRNFIELNRASLLTPTGRRVELEKLAERLETLAPGPQRGKMAAALLRTAHVDDPSVRSSLHSIWISDFVARMGTDDGSAEYQSAFFRAFSDTQNEDRLRPRRDIVSRYDDFTLLREAAKRTVAQPELARAMQSYALRFDPRSAMQLFVGGHALDFMLEGSRASPAFREAFIEFVTTPYSEDSAQTFRERCGELFPGTAKLRNGRGRGPSGHGERFGTWLRERLDEERWRTADIHANFWAAPLVLRIGAIRELLLPQTDDDRTKLRETPQDVPQETFDYVMSKVLPEEGPESELARRAIRSWISHLSPYEKHFKLAGLLVASEPSYQGRNSVGERLAVASGAMNAFVKKVAQRVPGLPFVDHEFAAPFERLTFDASDESRWQALEWVEERREAICDAYHRARAQKRLPPAADVDERGRVYIKRYGEVLGAGSLYVTIELEMSDGTNHVLAMRRPHAIETAEEEYRIARSTVADIRERSAAWDALNDMMAQVNERMRLEVNCRAAHAQYELAEEIYGKYAVEVDGEAFPTEVVRVTAAGDNFYMMTKAEGQHLIEAVNDDSIPAERRARLLQAALTFDLSRMLRGRFDADRTGGQTKVNGKLSMFDFKALSLEPWSESGLEQFGALMVRAVSRMQAPGAMMEMILDEERMLREKREPVSPFLGEAKMLLLTLGRYMKPGYLSEQQLKRCVVSALLNEVHPAIARGALRECPAEFRDIAAKAIGLSGDVTERNEAREMLLAVTGLKEEELIRITKRV